MSVYETRSDRAFTSIIRQFFQNASSGGLVLMCAAGLALIVANSPLAPAYFNGLDAHIGGMSVLHWINDGLMAVFFLLVGLEIKRELVSGELATRAQRILPGAAALGGMAGPALIYLALNQGADGQPTGWAIPAATDIAFALGVLTLLGNRVPLSLKVFLTALAISDDLGAVIIIAVFYSGSLNVPALVGAIVITVLLYSLNRFNVLRLLPYLVLGILLWLCVLKSGVHATLAGVVLAQAIPLKPPVAVTAQPSPPLHILEHAISPWVAYLVLPIFGFANAGVSLLGVSLDAMTMPVPLGIMLGLLIGKQLGIMIAAATVVGMGWAVLPAQATWRQLYGVSLLCGIGFTMSLFIGLLAFPDNSALQGGVKLGVLFGSTLSALAGAMVLRPAPRTATTPL